MESGEWRELRSSLLPNLLHASRNNKSDTFLLIFLVRIVDCLEYFISLFFGLFDCIFIYTHYLTIYSINNFPIPLLENARGCVHHNFESVINKHLIHIMPRGHKCN